MLYNEACAPIVGEKHPQALGRSLSVAFAEAWPPVRHIFEQAYQQGKATKIQSSEVFLSRRNDLSVSVAIS